MKANLTKLDKPVWALDAETDPFEHGLIPEPFIWGLYCGDSVTGDAIKGSEPFYREFIGSGPAFTCTRNDIDELVDYLSEQDVIVYAHNGGKFDYHFLSHRFEPGTDLLIINGRIARFTIGKCEFRDSFNLMPVALAQYNKTKFDYSKMTREHRAAHMPEIKEYLKSDCVNLWNMVTGFVDTYGLHITQASAAMHFWQRTLKNPVPRSGPGLYTKIKPYYYGGRVQCFEQGDLNIEAHSIDINSAYPFAMLSKHPYSLEYVEHEGKPKRARSKWGPMFFTIECISKGAFPYRGSNDSLYFPDDGKLRIYDVTGWELIAAINTNTVDEIKFLTHIEFNEIKDFSQYVNHFWDLRQEFKASGDKGGTFYTKIFLNALYGKFATDPRKYKNYSLKPVSALKTVIEGLGEGDTFKHFREWLIVAEHRGGHSKGRFYNLATAASITGYVRAMLWTTICSADRPLYCDTDSITACGFSDDIILSSELGDWDIEYQYDRCIMAGKKLYAFHKVGGALHADSGWKVASKGARLHFGDLIKIAAGERILFKNDAPTFSAAKAKPTFVEREIKKTAQDIRFVPRRFDPMLNEE